MSQLTRTLPAHAPPSLLRSFGEAGVRSLNETLEERLVGGKAAGLSRLLRLGIAVPRGVVIPASTTATFDGDAIPDEAWCEIVEAWHTLAAPMVIVRSSAVGEDSVDASFAGQLDSIPEVRDEQDLRRAVIKCWRSRNSDRVLAYERARGHALAGLGIVIQAQIDASMSGVLFTNDPSGGGGALIEYCAGAGEDLVAGRINPGRVAVSTAGDVRHTAAASDVVLQDEAARELAAAGRRIAAAFGAPQDIEWTIDSLGADVVRAGAADYGDVVSSA